jgi:L-ascorbate metabolism protein UlaG (beta-lactamase superfamily)
VALLPVEVIHTIVHGYFVLLVKNGKTKMNAIRIDGAQASPNLAAAIGASRPADHAVHFWWLGQAGFALRHGSTLLLVDPYLSDSLAEKYRHSEFKHLRMMPTPVAPQDLRGCTWYLCTHGHTDHMDPGTIRGILQAAAPAFLLPRAELARGSERGMPVERMHGINAGEARQLTTDLSVEAIAAAHEALEVDAEGNYKFLGYVISAGGLRLYHSGDCVPYPGLEQRLAQKQIDVAFLPINGRDAFRLSKGVPGNFTLAEAIALCQAAGISYLVGHHWGMFDFNTIDPEVAAAILRQDAGPLNWLLPEIGVTYTIQLD